ncbi:MAG: DNA repair exonuclease [Clostridia bacterium]|nr:DNA repair exonuclease [Clostridia bacterium]
MQKIKILHTADLHLGSAFSSFPAEMAKERQKELLACFDTIVELVKSEKAELFLIAGDLFDHPDCICAAEYVNAKFAEIPDTKVFIAAGNHDPKRLIYDSVRWNRNVHIFGSRLEKVEYEHYNVYGASFSQSCQSESLLERVDTDEKINILVMHGDLSKTEYNPIDAKLLSQFDYSALGHIHKFSGIGREGGGFFAYSGSPEGRGFDELGEMGVIIGEVGKRFSDLSFRPTMKRIYERLTVDVGNFENNAQLAQEIMKKILSENLYDISLTGENGGFAISTEYIKACIEPLCFFVKVSDNTKMNEDYTSMANDCSLKGLFIKNMLSKINAAESEDLRRRYHKALEYGVMALDGRDVLD